MNAVMELEIKRFQYLNKLYELSGGSAKKISNMFEIGKELGFDETSTKNIVYYLKDEGLIKIIVQGGGIAITHSGVLEVEEAFSHPDTPTQHFPPNNIIFVGQMTNSQIQQSSPEARQIVTFNGIKYKELEELIQSLQESLDSLGLDPQKSLDLQAQIKTMELQMSTSTPNSIILSESLHSIRRIVEGAVSSALASGILTKIGQLLSG